MPMEDTGRLSESLVLNSVPNKADKRERNLDDVTNCAKKVFPVNFEFIFNFFFLNDDEANDFN